MKARDLDAENRIIAESFADVGKVPAFPRDRTRKAPYSFDSAL
jgi:hypothetical protein